MARVLRPPAPLALAPGERSLFLAGSIEMGRAAEWQSEFERAFADDSVTVLNPRRREWDASWGHTDADPRLCEQVEWELSALEAATLIAMYFAPGTKAPVTLLELGLFARSGRLLVCCPPDYWRQGNVAVVCARYGVPAFPDLPSLIDAARARLSL